jgi:hypothetical protein
MRRLTMIVCVCVAAAGPVRAQASATHDEVNVDQLWETARQHTSVADEQRAQIMRVLNHPLTAQVARDYGLDLGAARQTVPVLDAKELQQISARAAVAEQALAGGSNTITISTTVIIIALLVIILILVA